MNNYIIDVLVTSFDCKIKNPNENKDSENLTDWQIIPFKRRSDNSLSPYKEEGGKVIMRAKKFYHGSANAYGTSELSKLNKFEEEIKEECNNTIIIESQFHISITEKCYEYNLACQWHWNPTYRKLLETDARILPRELLKIVALYES